MSLLKSILAENLNDLYGILEEDKGNLSEIPDTWMNVVAKGSLAIGGKGSEIVELASPVNSVSKYRTTIIDAMKENEYVAVFVKVEGQPFALIYKSKDLPGVRAEYSIVAIDGEKSKIQKRRAKYYYQKVKNPSTGRYNTVIQRSSYTYEQEGMPMSTLLMRLQNSIALALSDDENEVNADNIFKESTIEIYGITPDANRLAKRKERLANRPAERSGRDSMRADLVAADKKYLKSKANEVAKILQDEISEVLVKLQEKVVSMFDGAAEGKQMKFDVNAELAEITAKINDLQKIAQAINLAVGSEGIPELVERWRGLPEIIEKQRGLRKSYRLENLLAAIKEVKDRRDKDK
jgi:hypothetical protein